MLNFTLKAGIQGRGFLTPKLCPRMSIFRKSFVSETNIKLRYLRVKTVENFDLENSGFYQFFSVAKKCFFCYISANMNRNVRKKLIIKNAGQ